MIKPYNLGFAKLSVWPSFALNRYKSRSKGRSSTGCFIKDLTFFLKLMTSNVTLNLSVPMGATSVRWRDQKISHNSIKLKDLIKRIVVLVLGERG